MNYNAVFLSNDPSQIDRVFANGRREKLNSLLEFYPELIGSKNFDKHISRLHGVELIFSTWGMPTLNAEQIRLFPKLKVVFYAAGSVKHFAGPFLDCGVKVVSAWAANAIPVAEFTLAQILLSCKGYFRNSASCRDPKKGNAGALPAGRGIFGETVALLGAGQIGRKVIELLKPFNLKVAVVDPCLSDAEALLLGVRKISLEEAFQTAYVVSNHLPDLPELRGVLTGAHFRSMRKDATFINTARGAEVNENELSTVLRERPDITALLDVTFPEPPAPDSPFYSVPNLQLSSHIAGSINDEVLRMADYMIEEFQAWREDRPLRFEVSHEMLRRMA
ncbi:MAG: hypothetical protein A2X49_04210 [Lentisphaerae bacterium GWF2_52_8]|nr:MAG: hypothetical protein A2X49_04210 [Lentisphaerae bacterium GWF2_52_8]